MAIHVCMGFPNPIEKACAGPFEDSLVERRAFGMPDRICQWAVHSVKTTAIPRQDVSDSVSVEQALKCRIGHGISSLVQVSSS